MRNTSFRRRSGLRVLGPVTSPGTAASRVDVDITVTDDDDATTAVCVHCGARLRRLANGNPAAHAPGGVRANTRRGAYKCEGSGNNGD
jgi:hypothetical protein